MIIKVYFLPNVTGWQMHVGRWWSDSTNQRGRDIWRIKKLGQC